ncbi:MAG: DUF1311 domain-containing protein [Alphaproteobacteria bacterium]|nr:DUF1311 domain-containing protein [Alphaproteobacteria bacterium]
MKFTFILFIAFTCLTSISYAEDLPLDCASPATFSQSRDCAELRLAAAENQMAEHYQFIRTLLTEHSTTPFGESGDNSAEFIASQQAWLIYRDQACKAEGLLYWGTSLEFSMADQCLERITNTRINELKHLRD